MVAGMDEAGAQLLGGGRGLHLLLHAATLIGQLDDELCHVFCLPDRGCAGLLREFFLRIQGTSFCFLFS